MIILSPLDSLPLCIGPASEASDLFFFPQIGKSPLKGRIAYSWTNTPQVSYGKMLRQALYGSHHHFSFSASCGCNCPHPCFKLFICRCQHAYKVVPPRTQVVFGIVPSLRAFIKRFVVSFLTLLHYPLQTYVASDLISALIKEQQRQQPSNPSVAFHKGVNALKIEDECCYRKQRVNFSLCH